MEFDPTTAVPVIERPDGLKEISTFDPTTARPISEQPDFSVKEDKRSYGLGGPGAALISPKGALKFRPPMNDQDRARAVYESILADKGEKVPINQKLDWALTSQGSRAFTKAAMMTMITGGLYPFVQGATGAMESDTELPIGERIKKGVLYPEYTKELFDKIPGSEKWPTWGRVVAGLTEAVIKYGVAGAVKHGVKSRLFAKQLAARAEVAAKQAARDLIKEQGGATVEKITPGLATKEQLQAASSKYAWKKLEEKVLSDRLLDQWYEKLGAFDTATLETGIQGLYKDTNFFTLIGNELRSRGVSVGMSVGKPVVGQTVAFTEGGKKLAGKVLEVLGDRVKIEMGKSIIVASTDQLINAIAYHGSPKEFKVFSLENANPESDLGAGLYFSSSAYDVQTNYANVKGADLQNKIDRRTDEIFAELEAEYTDEDFENGIKRQELEDQARKMAEQELVGDKSQLMKVELDMKNPVVLGGEEETILEMEIPVDENGDWLDEEPTGTLIDFIDGMKNTYAYDADVDRAAQELMEAANYESISASEAVKILKESEAIAYAVDDQGRLFANEIIRNGFENAGYDGIIDKTVDFKFGSQRKVGKPMEAMDPDTIHYVVFNPDQVKTIGSLSIGRPSIDEKDIVNKIDPNLSQDEKVQELVKLTGENEPIIEDFIKEIDSKLGTESKTSRKDPEKIKANRPEILEEKPYFDVEHIRDSFRFKSRMEDINKLPDIIDTIIDRGWEIVKLDTKKMFAPKVWGWRFFAMDLRLPNGQLVEYYCAPRELDLPETKKPNHDLFEFWREKDQAYRIENYEQYIKDITESRDRYGDAWQEYLKRVGQTESEALASFNSAVISAESSIGSKLESRSSAAGASTDQTPSDLTAVTESSATQTRPEDLSIDPNNISSSPSNRNIPQEGVDVNEDVDPWDQAEAAWDVTVEVTPETIKPRKQGISLLEEKISKLSDNEQMLAIAKESLEYIKGLQKDFSHRIMPHKKMGVGDLAAEYEGLPGKYKTKTDGITMDEAKDELLRSGIEVDDLGEYLHNLDSQASSLREQIKDLKTPYVKMKEMTHLKQRIKDIQMGIRSGKVAAKNEVLDVGNQIIRLLSDSELDTADKGAFNSLIKNITTQDQLDKAMPAIEERIAKIEDLKRKRKLIKKFKDLNKKSIIDKLRPEYRKAVKDIIDQFDSAKLSDKKVKQLNKLADYLSSNPDNMVPQEKIDELKRLDLTPIKDLNADQIDAIVSSIQHLIKLNDLKNKLIVKGKIRDHVEVVNEAMANVKKNFGELDGSISGLDSMMKTPEDPGMTKFIDGYSANAELQCEILDGEDGGIIQEVMYKGLDRGTDKQINFMTTGEDFFRDKLKGINIDNWSSAFQVKKDDVVQYTHKIFGYDEPIKITPGEKIALYLHTLNDQNLKHLMDGGFAFPNTPTKFIQFKDPADIWNIVNSLTKDELKVAMAMNEYLNTIQKDAINEVSVNLNGFEIALVDNYFPIRTNWLDRFKDELLKGQMGFNLQVTLEGMGIFKTRQDTGNAIILEDAFVALSKSIKQTSAYVGLAEPLRSAKALLNDNDFQKVLIDAGKKYHIDLLKDYITKIEGEYTKVDDLDRLTQDLINKLDLAILGFKPFIILKQPVSYFLSVTEMDGKFLKGSFNVQATEEEINEIITYCPQLRERLKGNISREVGEVMNVGFTKKFFTGKDAGAQWIMKGILKADTAAITSIWRAVKKELQAKYPNLKGNEFYAKAYERAWEVIRRTQPTFHVKDRSPIGRKREWFFRLLTKYSSQRNKNLMIQRRAFERWNRSHKTPKDKAALVKTLFLVNVVSAGMIAAINKLNDIVMNRDPKKSVVVKKEEANIFEQFVVEMVKSDLGNIYFIGPLFDSLISKLQQGTYGGYDISDPVMSTVNDFVDTMTEAVNVITYAISQERYDPKGGRLVGEKKWKESLKKFVVGSADLSGKFRGIPIDFWRKFIVAQYERATGNKKKKKKIVIKD